MIQARKLLSAATIVLACLAGGCAEDTTQLKQKLMDLEKRIAAQEKSFEEFSRGLAAPKDFSAEIQRLEEQQEAIKQFIGAKVDPINMKLEEFRDWAQESQVQRGKLVEKLKSLEAALAELRKAVEASSDTAARIAKDFGLYKQKIQGNAKAIQDLSNALAGLKKDILESNTKLAEAVRKTLPKVKQAAVDSALLEMRGQLAPIEKRLAELKSEIEAVRKEMEGRPGAPPGPAAAKDIRLLQKKLTELEEIVASQKSFLLELGSKLHKLETSMQ